MAVAEDPSSLEKEPEAQSSGPAPADVLELEEWKTYFVRFYGDPPPDYFSGIALLRRDTCFVRQLDNWFEVNFKNSVGMTRVGPLKVRVRNRKISELMYNSILNYIAERYANLVFSFNVPLGQSYKKDDPGSDIAYIEYLFLKTYLLDKSPNLDGIASLIFANPHMKFHSEHAYKSIDQICSFEPEAMLRTLTKTDGFALLSSGHPLLATGLGRALNRRAGKNYFPSQAFEKRRYHTVDTNENRFIKYFLGRAQHRMASLTNRLRGVSGSFLNPDIEDNAGEMVRKLNSIMSDPLWQDVGPMTLIPENSQVLQRRDGYRQLYSLYSLLQLCTRCDFETEDFKNLLETKDTPTLFEYWSFFVVKSVLDGMRKVVSCRNIISEDYREQRVSRGISIEYEDGVSLWFNKSYSGSTKYQPGPDLSVQGPSGESYSHELRPDIVVSKNGNLLIFDAKYKGKEKNGTFYGEDDQGGISSCKENDIDKMHTYREAIENVVGAFILYPGEELVMYASHKAKKHYEGVGAFPLKPMREPRPVREHLRNISRVIDAFLNEG